MLQTDNSKESVNDKNKKNCSIDSRYNTSAPLPLKHFFNNPSYSDVILVVGYDGQQIENFFASRILIAAWSPPLSRLLCGPFCESGTRRIRINDIDPEIFRTILKFLYQCDDVALTHQNVCQVIRVSDQLCIERLLHYCEDYLIAELNKLETLRMSSLSSVILETSNATSEVKLQKGQFDNIATAENYKISRNGIPSPKCFKRSRSGLGYSTLTDQSNAPMPRRGKLDRRKSSDSLNLEADTTENITSKMQSTTFLFSEASSTVASSILSPSSSCITPSGIVENGENEDLLRLLVKAFHLSSDISILTELRLECLRLLGHSKALSDMLLHCGEQKFSPMEEISHQPLQCQKESTEQSPHLLLRLPIMVLKEMLQSELLEAEEELLLLSVLRYVVYYSKKLTKLYSNEFSKSQQFREEMDVSDSTSIDQNTTNATNSAPPISTSLSSEFSNVLSTPVPIRKKPATHGLPEEDSISRTIKLNPRKRKMSYSQAQHSKQMKLKFGKKCNHNNITDSLSRHKSTVSVKLGATSNASALLQSINKDFSIPPTTTVTTTPNSSGLLSTDNSQSPSTTTSFDIVNLNSKKREYLIPLRELSFSELCQYLDLPPSFFIKIFSTYPLKTSSLEAQFQYMVMVILYHSLEPYLRYVFVPPQRLAEIEVEFLDASLVKQAILWHFNSSNSPTTETLTSSPDLSCYSDEDSNIDNDDKIRILRQKSFKAKSLRRLRHITLYLYSLMGFSSNFKAIQSQRCTPRSRLLPFGWKVNENRLILYGKRLQQIVVRGEMQPPPLDWTPAIANYEYRYGFHEFFFRIDSSSFNNIIIGITTTYDDQLASCCHSNGKSKSLVLYHGDERDNPNRIFVKGKEPIDGDIIYMRLDLRRPQGSLEFYAVRRKRHTGSCLSDCLKGLGSTANLQRENPTPEESLEISPSSPMYDNTPIEADVQGFSSALFNAPPLGFSTTVAGIRTPTRTPNVRTTRRRLDHWWRRRRLYDELSAESLEDPKHAAIITSPILSSNRLSINWKNCGNVLLGQHTTPKGGFVEKYYYEIWELGKFNELPNHYHDYSSSYNNSSLTPNVYDHSNAMMSSPLGLHQRIAWRPFIDLRDLNDSIALLPYQHDVVPFIPQERHSSNT